jgi:glycosyltransferase involved in cell wall biosynthesis
MSACLGNRSRHIVVTSHHTGKSRSICFVAHSALLGGADQVLLETINALRCGGIECSVLLPSDGPLLDELLHLGIRCKVISYPLWMTRDKPSIWSRLRTVLGTLVNTLLVIWQIYRWQSTLVYSNTSTVCVGAFAAKMLGRDHVWHVHEFGYEDHRLRFMFGEALSYRLMNRLSSRCIFVSTALARKFRPYIDKAKIHVIYPSMGFSAGKCESSRAAGAHARLRCAIVGTLMEGKGQQEAILAISHLNCRGIDAELVIAGDGLAEYRDKLIESMRTLGVESKVTLLGHVSNPGDVMSGSDVVLVCSTSEAFGRVTVEAMFARRPVIGARSAATEELINDGVTGLLYTPGDAEDLATKIALLNNNPNMTRLLAGNAVAWVRAQFSHSRYSQQMSDVIDGLFGRRYQVRDAPADDLIAPLK